MDIPQGYKQTELGIIPEDWEIVNLGSVAKINGRIGFRGYTTADLVGVGQGAYTIGGKHITNMVLDLHDAEYISWQKYYESPEIMVRKGDIVFAQRGTLGKSAFIVNDIGPATINPSLVLINKIKCDNEYLSYWLQFNALASYAIFISLIVISILVGTLLYGQQIDFSNVSIATSIEEVNVSLSIKMTLVCVVRFCVVYFLLDFFILTIYAVTSLFQLINLEMLSKQPTYNIRGNKVMEDKLVLKKEYPILSIISKIAIGISVVGIIAYEWENIVSAFQRLF